MKNWIPFLFICLLIVGCGPKKGSKGNSDRSIAELQTQMQMLQQTVEMQTTQIKGLELKIAALKAEKFKTDSSEAALKELEVRVSDLEGSGYLK